MKKKQKQPLTHKVAKVPIILQLEVLECGAACLTMILAYYGKRVPLEQVRIDCGVSRDGSNAKNILAAARKYGLNAKGYRYEPSSLKENGTFPCIIHWDFNHFVVLDGFKKNKAVINDPAKGLTEVSMEEFDESFTGVCIMLSPSDNFVADGKKKSIVNFISKRLKKEKGTIAFVALVSLISSVLGIINPVFSKIFIDQLLPGLNPSWLTPFFIFLITFTFIEVILSAINAIYYLKLSGKLAIKANAEYMWHVLRMPVEFFTQRLSGDITIRKSTNETATSTLINTLVPLIFNVIMIFIYLFLILRYSVVLTLIGVSGLIISVLVNQIISKKQANIANVRLRDEANLYSSTMSGIEMIETIKASGAENGFFQKWAGYQASVNRLEVQSQSLGLRIGLIPELVSNFVEIGVLGTGLYLIIKGNFTIGLLFAFQGLLTKLEEPLTTLNNTTQDLREMKNNMERIEDVLEYPIDDNLKENDEEVESYEKLKGKLELKNVTFGYSRLSPPLIENFNMVVEPGQKVAFVGASGCGKSTLSKLISGLYKPWSGEILFDGKPIDQIDRNVFTGSLAVVDQDITLFEDTIANNIKMWDSSIEDYEMILAARDASLHEDIMQRDNGYQYKMSEGGKDFSGGQRQRLEIARVLSQDPRIIIMDEATSALDAKTEYEVVEAIKDRGITCVVIAHRLSTIRDCDEIVVMEHGKIVERGSNEELMKKHGKYEELITSE